MYLQDDKHQRFDLEMLSIHMRTCYLEKKASILLHGSMSKLVRTVATQNQISKRTPCCMLPQMAANPPPCRIYPGYQEYVQSFFKKQLTSKPSPPLPSQPWGAALSKPCALDEPVVILVLVSSYLRAQKTRSNLSVTLRCWVFHGPDILCMRSHRHRDSPLAYHRTAHSCPCRAASLQS